MMVMGEDIRIASERVRKGGILNIYDLHLPMPISVSVVYKASGCA